MSPTTRGLFAMSVAVLIWAGWIVAVRDAAARVGAVDLAVLRYAIPAALLAPVWLRRGVLARGVAPWRVGVMTLGWGAPFVLMGAQGMKAADVSLFAAMVPGMMPLWLAALGAAFAGMRPSRAGLAGLGMIAAAGALALAGASGGSLAGAPWLAAASVGWAAYALAFRGAGLTPVEATAIVAFWSTVGLAPVVAATGSGLEALPVGELAALALAHGVLSGVVSVAAFAAAVRDLGVARAAAFPALVPTLAVAGAWVWLGEAPGVMAAAAVALAAAGVALVNRGR
jgi:drug/metabolite transporter (DMT)-like permease